MNRELAVVSGLLVAGVGLWACQPMANEETNKKLDEISKKLDALDKKVGAGGGQRPPMQPPPGPDPMAVYAIPIDGSPIRGGKGAKITIIEAFEFA